MSFPRTGRKAPKWPNPNLDINVSASFMMRVNGLQWWTGIKKVELADMWSIRRSDLYEMFYGRMEIPIELWAELDAFECACYLDYKHHRESLFEVDAYYLRTHHLARAARMDIEGIDADDGIEKFVARFRCLPGELKSPFKPLDSCWKRLREGEVEVFGKAGPYHRQFNWSHEEVSL